MRGIAKLLIGGLFCCSLGELQAQTTSSSSSPRWAGLDLSRLQRLRPLSPFDTDGDYRLLDALSSRSVRNADTLRRHSILDVLLPPVLGYELNLGRGWSLIGDGLVDVFKINALDKQYNQYEGSWVGYEWVLTRRLGAGRKLVLRTNNNYAVRSHRWMSENNLLYFYALEQSGILILSGGQTPRETTHQTNEELFVGQNMGMLGANNSGLNNYLRTYISLRNSIYLTPKLRLNTQVLYEYRKPYAWVENISPLHQSLLLEFGAYYSMARTSTPSADYTTAIQNPVGFFSPELGVVYRVGLDPTKGNASVPFSRYDMLELSLRHSYAWNDANRLRWGISLGGFFSRGYVSDADTRALPRLSGLGREPLGGRWATLPYGFELGKRWLWGYADYHAGRMLLARLSPLRLLDEAIHLRALHAEHSRAWYELGYSIGLGGFARMGVFAGSDRLGWGVRSSVGVRFSLPILFLISSASSRY